ncbi:MAG: extracellular solute-binding protein, partial [Bifidobacteriales bacterium]|nr:extracellular solute-binding protein [Bifidobacteriales bacterium]
MKLKVAAASLLSVVLLATCAACGGNSASGDGKVNMTMMHNSTLASGKNYYEKMAKEFEKANPNVSIQIQAIQNEDYEGKIQTAMQDQDSAPDIFYSRGGQKLRDMVEAGQVQDITDTISSTVKQQMKTGLASHTVDGKVYGVPSSMQPGGFWYSKDLFSKAGIAQPPKTLA